MTRKNIEEIKEELLTNCNYNFMFRLESEEKSPQSPIKSDYVKIDQSFNEVRNKHAHLQADREAEAYIQNLREIGEYNRWALKLTQKWLNKFIHRNFFNAI